MLTRNKIRELFERLNQELLARGQIGDIGIVGGATMCLVYNARDSTKDVDAIFEPTAIIREIAVKLAIEEDIPTDWLYDAAKGFIQPGFLRQEVLNLSNLRVWAPEPRLLLAMKCISARWDTHDRDDVIFLIKFLAFREPAEVFAIIEGFYPKNSVPPKTRFFIEEIMQPAA